MTTMSARGADVRGRERIGRAVEHGFYHARQAATRTSTGAASARAPRNRERACRTWRRLSIASNAVVLTGPRGMPVHATAPTTIKFRSFATRSDRRSDCRPATNDRPSTSDQLSTGDQRPTVDQRLTTDCRLATNDQRLAIYECRTPSSAQPIDRIGDLTDRAVATCTAHTRCWCSRDRKAAATECRWPSRRPTRL
jgi:hypothetical protein